jgi:hypothetical protein
MSDVVYAKPKPKGNVSSVIAAQAKRIEELEAQLTDCQVERDDHYVERTRLEADNALLRAFVEAWDNWFGERGGINPALDKLKVLTDARRALLDAAGEPGR